ncbi:DegT/DnrJ/EryC1/StrS family aminotransferase [Elongatibacter sediminis]|uniref:DegT/DnrJ/EryC1/StrS family aminotransferase n=1 Tax=Elongatibacter sediminis TaxID=3119006 RepID=A0AAW9REB7_9GAMM
MPTDESLIHVFGSLLGDEELAEISDCIDRQWIGMGPKTAQLESRLAQHLDVDELVLLNSGSSGLQMAVHLLDIPPGTGAEIIVPSFTWVACASAILLAGHRPVFCDVDKTTLNIDPESVAGAITPRTAAIMAVHYAGLPAEVPRLKEFGLPVIEDAAHAIDSRHEGRACGTLGDIGVFSFDSIKNLAMGEGGGLVARNPEHLRRARDLRLCGVTSTGFASAREGGRWWEHRITDAFPKMTPSDLCAAVGLAQFRRLRSSQQRRAKLWALYQQALAELDWLAVPPEPDAGDRHSYFTYCVQVRDGRRDALANHLLERGIYTTLRFHPLHLSPLYGSSVELPVSERLAETALNLPLHPRLTDDDLDRVIGAVCEFAG